MQAQADDIPPFWYEPWRWAAPAWYGRYGAPRRHFDCRAQRLVFSGWIECFDLPRQWRRPADQRWLPVVLASPERLQGLASVLGYIALFRAGVSPALACRSPIDPWLTLALKFRDINCMRFHGGVTRLDLSASHTCGVGVLRAMAQRDWPDIDSRLAMLIPPPSFDRARHPTEEMQRRQAMQAQTLALESIDVGRCLSLCGAVTRHASARPVL